MVRPKTGTIWRSEDGTELKARITVKDDLGRTHRPWLPLDPRFTDTRARAVAAKISVEAQGKPWNPERAKRVQLIGSSPTVEDYVQKVWFPSRVEKIKSLRSDRSRWRLHLSPLIGHLRMHEVTSEHLRQVVEELDDKAANNAGVDGRDFGEKTAVNCWAVVTAMFRDAFASKRKDLRILPSNPALGVLPPDGPDDVEKQWLFPDELRQLLACAEVPLWRRRMYAVCVYLFCRPGEVLALMWGSGVDLQHGLVRINRAYNSEKKRFNEYTKTGDTRHFALEPILLPLLEAMRAEAGDGVGLLFPTTGNLARALREDLWRAGVRREALHVKRKGARMMRFHDLRATGITYMALRGDSDNHVRDRAGHTDFKTTLEYIRRGQHATGARMGDPFAALPAELLENAPDQSSGVSSEDGGGEGESGADLAVSAGDALPGHVTEDRPHAVGTPFPSAPPADNTAGANGQDDSKTIESLDPEAVEFAVALGEHQGAQPPARPPVKAPSASADAARAARGGDL
jgi:integrase